MRLTLSNAGRPLDATLDTPDIEGSDDADGGSDADDAGDADTEACVVACPPHPQHGGSRSDERLRAVSDALVERGVACLRVDYGPWDEGRGERRDAVAAVAAMRARGYERVALFGYSFGAAVALLAGEALLDTDADADAAAGVDAVSVLAPPSRLGTDAELRVVDAFESLSDAATPVQVVYGTRDETVEWSPVVDAARERGSTVVELSADHFFVGQSRKVADAVGPFLVESLVG